MTERIPSYYVTGLSHQGIEGPLSAPAGVSLPLPPIVTSPLENATVDAAGVSIEGRAQPGALIEVSLASGGVLVAASTATAASCGSIVSAA